MILIRRVRVHNCLKNKLFILFDGVSLCIYFVLFLIYDIYLVGEFNRVHVLISILKRKLSFQYEVFSFRLSYFSTP